MPSIVLRPEIRRGGIRLAQSESLADASPDAPVTLKPLAAHEKAFGSQEKKFRRAPESYLDRPLALATMIDVLPLPAAAATRLRQSYSTTTLRCFSVSDRDSILSSKERERLSSFATSAWLALCRAPAGASRNLRMPLSTRILVESDNDCGHRPASDRRTRRRQHGDLQCSDGQYFTKTGGRCESPRQTS